MALTRRAFLERLGAVGGYSAVYLGMEAMGLLNAPPAAAEPFELPRAPGAGARSSSSAPASPAWSRPMSSAGAGWDVTVLEARDRIGGRVWTVRGGDRIVQTGRARPALRRFDQGSISTPARREFRTRHHAILGYARALGVPIEVMVNSNRAARWDFGGRVYQQPPARLRRARPLRRIARQGDRPAARSTSELSGGEKEALRQFLAFYGEPRRERRLHARRPLGL